MTSSIAFKTTWESLDSGDPEERSCFAAIAIESPAFSLTEALDSFIDSKRTQIYLSAYHLAEWLAWNWWRLRWEPRTGARKDWVFSHHMATIGNGYVWPNITIFSDGERVAFHAKPTRATIAEPMRYLADGAAVISAGEFELELDSFFDRVSGRLDRNGLGTSNFTSILDELRAERNDPKISADRKFEAILGYEPGEAPESLVQRLFLDGNEFGTEAIRELAAGRQDDLDLLDAKGLKNLASNFGAEFKLSNQVKLASWNIGKLTSSADTAAWLVGAQAANALREQEKLGQGPIQDQKLAEMCGVSEDVFSVQSEAPFSFSLNGSSGHDRVVLRKTMYATSKRFELARLLADRLAFGSMDRLFPATRSYTYRQKLQRSFAAQLLCGHATPLGVISRA